MKDGKEESLTWGDVLLGTLLFPYLLSIPYESEEEEKDEKKEPENQQPAAPEEAPDNIVHVSCEKEQPCEKCKSIDDGGDNGWDSVPEPKDESREEREYEDFFLSEYGDADYEDFLHNVVKNNSHDDYFALSKFIRDALADLESGSDELGWEYNPTKSVVELKINDHTEVTSQSATLFNCRAAETYMPVSIERRGDNEYYLVVEL